MIKRRNFWCETTLLLLNTCSEPPRKAPVPLTNLSNIQTDALIHEMPPNQFKTTPKNSRNLLQRLEPQQHTLLIAVQQESDNFQPTKSEHENSR